MIYAVGDTDHFFDLGAKDQRLVLCGEERPCFLYLRRAEAAQLAVSKDGRKEKKELDEAALQAPDVDKSSSSSSSR